MPRTGWGLASAAIAGIFSVCVRWGAPRRQWSRSSRGSEPEPQRLAVHIAACTAHRPDREYRQLVRHPRGVGSVACQRRSNGAAPRPPAKATIRQDFAYPASDGRHTKVTRQPACQ
jgi:hypothetical protein